MGAEDYCSEERTLPFSQTEFEMRVQQSIRIQQELDSEDEVVPLDQLVVDEHHHERGVRILLRPLTRSRSVSPGSENCEWLALQAEVSTSDGPQQPTNTVLAVTQTSKDINFALRIPTQQGVDETRPPLWCELYYDPASDNQILLNRSDVPIAVTRITRSDNAEPLSKQEIVPGTTKELTPGSWRVSVYGTSVIELRILVKRPAILWSPHIQSDVALTGASGNDLKSSKKRSFSSDCADGATEESVVKKARTDGNPDEEGVLMVCTNGEPLVFPLQDSGHAKQVAISSGHALVEVQQEQTVEITGGREPDKYRLTKQQTIATTTASSVFTANHSKIREGRITVKVLKTRNHHNANGDTSKNIIRQADIWLREYQSQEDLKHESIVKLLGGDARYLSFYMEHVDGKDLAARGVWRDKDNDHFLGSRDDAIRILKGGAGALNYVHQRRRIHNDIKPANVLYSRDRGAVLCDFGLSTHTNDPATNGGTPYYVPPEFIGHKLRGTPSDVWALGITMLYVLKVIPFPDARGRQGHPKQLYWIIADLNKHQRRTSIRSPPSAVMQMRSWIHEVHEARSKLDSNDKLHTLVAQMLIPNPNQRITMAKVMSELHKDPNLDK